MKKQIILLSTITLSTLALAQTNEGRVGINTPEPKATLDVMASPDVASRVDGFIAPRLEGDALQSKNALYTADQTGAIVYALSASPEAGTTGDKTINVDAEGYYYFDGTVWVKVVAGKHDHLWERIDQESGFLNTPNKIDSVSYDKYGYKVLDKTNPKIYSYDVVNNQAVEKEITDINAANKSLTLSSNIPITNTSDLNSSKNYNEMLISSGTNTGTLTNNRNGSTITPNNSSNYNLVISEANDLKHFGSGNISQLASNFGNVEIGGTASANNSYGIWTDNSYATSGNLGNAYGTYVRNLSRGSGNIGKMIGNYTYVGSYSSNPSSSKITTMAAFQGWGNLAPTFTGEVLNYYDFSALKVSDTGKRIKNKYGVHILGDDKINYFNGALRGGIIQADELSDTYSAGLYSLAYGESNKVSGKSSVSFGRNNKIYALQSGGFGFNNTVETGVINAFAFGESNEILPLASTGVTNNAFTVGYLNKLRGNESVLLGSRSLSVSNYAYSLGNQNYINGEFSLALGRNNIVGEATYTQVGEVRTFTADGTPAKYSAAIGYDNYVNGKFNTAIGSGLKSASKFEVVVGSYNSITTGDADSWIATEPIFQVGNGTTDANRKNAMTVYKNGDVEVPKLKGTGNAYACINADGVLFRSATPCN